ncbi:MAG: hypothetical protein ABSD41_05980 [Candidatus Bathyarchaeia archaeon]
MVDVILQTAAAFSLINVLLLIALIAVYVNSFRKIRAGFTAGLIFFSTMFLIQNLIALYSYLAMFMYYAAGVSGLVLTITIAQTVGLVVLLWLSFR